jgi:putative copper resistance protein D
MLATIGLAAALGQTPPPVTARAPLPMIEVILGYGLGGPPSPERLALDWRFDLIYGPLAMVLASCYLLGVRQLRRRGEAWPPARTLLWLAGCLLLLLATSSGIGRYAPAMFSVHMGQTVLLALWIPALLVLGGPATLALRALLPARDGLWGPREWLRSLLDSPTLRVLTSPAVSPLLFVGSFVGLHFSGLFDLAVQSRWAWLGLNAVAVLTGYLLFWPAIGVDPAPCVPRSAIRVTLVAVATLSYAAFGLALVIGYRAVIGSSFYRSLSLPWAPNILSDQQLGGQLALAAGLLSLLLAVIAGRLTRA